MANHRNENLAESWYTQNSKMANQRYRKKIDTIGITVKKGNRAIIQKHAEANEESTNAFILRAIKECFDSDVKREPEKYDGLPVFENKQIEE